MRDSAKLAPKSVLLLSAALTASGVLFGAPFALAQDTGGVVLNFGINQSLRSESNPGLANPAAAASKTSRTQLSFGIVSETRTQKLAFAAQGVLLAGDTTQKGISEPSASLSYQREAADTLLNLSASLREQDVDTLDFITTSTDALDPVVTSVSGIGTRRLTSYGGKLEFGREAPFGGTFSLNRADVKYSGTTDPTLIDSTRNTANVSLRFALDPTIDLTTSVSVSRLKEVAAGASTTKTASLGLDYARPNGTITTEFKLTDTPSGQRKSLDFGRSLDLPTGNLTAHLGASTLTGGGTSLIGNLAWRQDLPNGKILLNLSQSVAGDAGDNETRISRLSLGYNRDLTPRLSGNISMGLQSSTDTATNARTKTGSLSANLSYVLTEDWGLNFGATQRIRKKASAPQAKSTTLSISLQRNFEFRP